MRREPHVTKRRNNMPESETPIPAEATTAAETPDWAKTTPPDSRYAVSMYNEERNNVEEIDDLTREEYIALKRRLAELRRILPARVGSVITQEELQIVRDHYLAAERIGWILGRRAEQGAKFEDGPIKAEYRRGEGEGIMRGGLIGPIDIDWPAGSECDFAHLTQPSSEATQ
jgi:hypothetical protein